MVNTAEKIGFKTLCFQCSVVFLSEIDLPVILHWNLNHFVVLFEIEDDFYNIADPGKGILTLSKPDFLSHWQNNENAEGTLLILYPTSDC